jgi:galactoside O-acetyltransferase
MGDGTYANPGMTVVNIIGTDPDVIIGKNVSIAPNVVLVTHSAPNNSTFLQHVPYVAEQLTRHAKITISDEVWLGAGVIILPGVTIGRGAIVGAGAVVLDDIPPMTVVAGVPARVIRVLELQSMTKNEASTDSVPTHRD